MGWLVWLGGCLGFALLANASTPKVGCEETVGCWNPLDLGVRGYWVPFENRCCCGFRGAKGKFQGYFLPDKPRACPSQNPCTAGDPEAQSTWGPEALLPSELPAWFLSNSHAVGQQRQTTAACGLRYFSPSAAAECLGRQGSVAFHGASFTRDIFTALTGFLLRNHTWDLGDGAPPECRAEGGAGRYIHSKICHEHIRAYSLNATHSCIMVGDMEKWSYERPVLACRRVSTAPGVNLHLAMGNLQVRKGNGLLSNLRSGRVPRKSTIVVGFHHGMSGMGKEKFSFKLNRTLTENPELFRQATMIFHGMHSRDQHRVPPAWFLRQNNTRMRVMNLWIRDFVRTAALAHGPALYYWDQFSYGRSGHHTGYTTPPFADGSHLPLHHNVVKAQALLNFLCPADL